MYLCYARRFVKGVIIMARIPQEELTTLKAASAVKTVAASAIAELEEMQVAHCINEAANCGQYQTVYCRPISDTLLAKLKTNGYTITNPVPIAKSKDEYIISWNN
jgi:hypothetical protein